MINKLIRDGMVAVIVSPGYGAGWSTWNLDMPTLAFAPEIAQALLDGNREDAVRLAEALYPDAYAGGLFGAEVEWVPQGERFTIEEYDGNESLVILGPDYGLTA